MCVICILAETYDADGVDMPEEIKRSQKTDCALSLTDHLITAELPCSHICSTFAARRLSLYRQHRIDSFFVFSAHKEVVLVVVLLRLG